MGASPMRPRARRPCHNYFFRSTENRAIPVAENRSSVAKDVRSAPSGRVARAVGEDGADKVWNRKEHIQIPICFVRIDERIAAVDAQIGSPAAAERVVLSAAVEQIIPAAAAEVVAAVAAGEAVVAALAFKRVIPGGADEAVIAAAPAEQA